jgi:Fe-S cluster assembly ATP-binding protein
MLEVKDLTVSIEGKKDLLKDISLYVNQGETIVLFGPNGSGKTSLLKAIMGIPMYRIETGRIMFKGVDITDREIDERARLGIGMAFQRPPVIRGVRLEDMLNTCKGKVSGADKVRDIAERLNIADFLNRDINMGFSGGEIKRSELAQLLAQDPDFIMLDEPDSGVDLVSINLIGDVINELLEKDKKAERRRKAGLIITHAGHILDYINADRAYVMLDGTISCSGNPRDLLEDIKTKGYEGCVRCLR